MKIRHLILNPIKIFSILRRRGFLRWMPDSLYLKLCFKEKIGRWPDLKNPRTFNEKIQWLKLHDRNPLYTQLVDKYEVRKYIAETIGEKYLIPLLGVWDSFDEIDFDKLAEPVRPQMHPRFGRAGHLQGQIQAGHRRGEEKNQPVPEAQLLLYLA